MDLAEQGLSAAAVIDRLRTRAGPATLLRQPAVIDMQGSAAVFSGQRTLGRHGHHIGEGAVAAGNMLASDDVPRVMIAAFALALVADLAERLVRALEDGLVAWGLLRNEPIVASAATSLTPSPPYW